jgi:hypothetical protein
MTACSRNATTNDKHSSQATTAVSTKQSGKKASTKAATSHSTTAPTRQPSTEEKIAMVLMAPGAAKYATDASTILQSNTPDTATPTNHAVYGTVPSGTTGYSLSANVRNVASFVVISGDQAYLYAGQAALKYEDLKAQALNVNLQTTWQKAYKNTELSRLAALIKVGTNQDSAPVTQTTPTLKITSPQAAIAYAMQQYPTDSGVKMSYSVMMSGDMSSFTTSLNQDHYYWLRGKHEGSTAGTGAGSYDDFDLLLDADTGTSIRDTEPQFQTVMSARLD